MSDSRGAEVYLCPKCGAKCDYTDENDYICATHSFVNPIRQRDGAILSGNGHGGTNEPIVQG